MSEVETSEPIANGDEPKPLAAADKDDEENETDDSSAKHDLCHLWMSSHHLGWLTRLPEKWPRCFSLLFGVVCMHIC